MRVIGIPSNSGPTLATGERHLAAGAVHVTPALTVLDGPRLGETCRIEEALRTVVIGRGDSAGFVLPDPTVSRQHARVFVVPEGAQDRVKIIDMGSRNGTFVNGERVGEAFLEVGDKIHLGDVLVRFDLLDPTDARFLEQLNHRTKEAQVDALTGLLRRTQQMKECRDALAACHARGQHCAVLMIDLDHFKRINDTYGHPVGDEALKVAAEMVASSIRAGDLAIRYGGEEILVLLVQTDQSGASEIGTRIRGRLKDAVIPGMTPGSRLTASQGLAVARYGEDLTELIARADAALYAAKRAGRDRIEIATDS